MCGRYLTPDEAAFERHWGVRAPDGYLNSFNLAPSQQAPVIRIAADGSRKAELIVWGFQPAWAKRAWINARSETVFTTSAFAQSARAQRCLVAAAGWYEWQGDTTPKQPYVLFRDIDGQHAPDHPFEPVSLAGIWTSALHAGEQRPTFAILTRAATSALASVHDRMPAVLDPAHYDAWLAADTPRSDLELILKAHGPAIATRRVSTYVNKPAHNDARCIA